MPAIKQPEQLRSAILIDGWPYDLMVSGETSYESEVTNFAVERDSNITDHIRPQPLELNLEVVVSNTPIGDIANDPTRQEQALDPLAATVLGTSITNVLDSMQPLPSAEAYRRLVAIRDERRTCTIEIPVASKTAKPGRRVFLNMALTSLSEKHDKDTAGGGFFTVSFRQIRIVDNRKVTVRTSIPGGQKKRTPQVKVGKAYRVDSTVPWIVGDTNANVDLRYSDGKGGPGSQVQYFWSSVYSSEFPYPVDPLQPLDSISEAAFKKYLDREIQNKTRGQQQQLRDGTGKVQLPDSLDMSHFQAPDTAPNPANPSGISKDSILLRQPSFGSG